MSIQKITESEIASHGVASLPSRPALPSLYEGRPLTASELKEAFDKLPRLIAERFNGLLDSFGLSLNGKTLIADAIATKLFTGHSLSDFFKDITNGQMYTYLKGEDGSSLKDQLFWAMHPSGTVTELDTCGVSGDCVFRALVEERKNADARAASLYRLSHVSGNPLSVCLQVNKNGVWQNASEPLVFPEDIFIKNGKVLTASANGIPEAGFVKGDKYLDLTLGGKEETHVFIKLSDLIENVTVKTEGDGDLITELTAQGNTLCAKKGLSSKNFITPQDLQEFEESCASKESLYDIYHKTALLEAAAEDLSFIYETDTSPKSARSIPENSSHYAFLSFIGGASQTRNLFNEEQIHYADSHFSIAFDKSTGSIILNGSLGDGFCNYANILLASPIEVAGKRISFTYRHVGGSFTSSNATVSLSFASGNEGGMPQELYASHEPFIGACDVFQNESFAADAPQIDQFFIYCAATDASLPCKMTFENYRLNVMVNEGAKAVKYVPFGLGHSPLSEIVCVGKNLCSVEKIEKGSLNAIGEEIAEETQSLRTGFSSLAEKTRYTLSCAEEYALNGVFIYDDNFRFLDVKNISSLSSYTFTSPLGSAYFRVAFAPTQIPSEPIDENYIENAKNSLHLQLEYGSAKTAYEPFEAQVYRIPETVSALSDYGKGISEEVFNCVDFEKKVYVRRVGERTYIPLDETDETLLTDGRKTLYPLEEPEYTDISHMSFDGFIEAKKNGAIFFISPTGTPPISKITYQIKTTEGETA